MLASRVAVIVLNYRGESMLVDCLVSLRPAIRQGDTILVVDNGRETALIQRVKARFPEIEILVPERNRGFAAGMNLGIQYLLKRGEFDAFWLFNNDATAFPETLDRLKDALNEKGAAALYSPAVFPGPDKPVWFAGGRIDFFRMRTEHQQLLADQKTPYETGFLTGCALFIPRKAVDQIGLFDERYFLYYEDADYSLRALRQGLKLWVVPSAVVYHAEASQLNPAKTYWLVRSGAEFFLRESRGLWRLWIGVYFPLRKLKNWIETRYTSQPLAREVKRAYTDVSL